MSYQGRVIAGAEGRPAAGVPVTVTRTGGIDIDPALLTLRTDSLGIFWIRAGAERVGEAEVRVEIGPQEGGVSVLARSFSLRTTRSKGDARWLGEWTLHEPARP